MNTNTWKLTGLAMATIGSLTLAQAEQGKGKSKKSGDRDERPSRGQILEHFDQDGDGQLSEEERAAMREEMEKRRGGPNGGPDGERPSREEMMKRFDADGDGQLSEEERATLRETMGDRGGRGGSGGNRQKILERFDADGDGKLDEAERAAMRESFGKRKGDRPDKD